MMENNQFFEFEEKNVDFPYYKDNDFLTKKSGLVLLFTVILFIFLIIGPIKFLENQEQLILFFVTIIPLLFISKGQYNTFFKKPKSEDISLIVLCVLGAFLLAFIFSTFSLFTGLSYLLVNHNTNLTQDLSLLSLILQIFQIFGEEILRVFVFLLILHLTFKHTKNRKLSMVIGILGALLTFGLLHVNSYDNMIYNIVFMGFGTFFELYPYLKTKNILLSVIVHMLFNVSVLLIQSL